MKAKKNQLLINLAIVAAVIAAAAALLLAANRMKPKVAQSMVIVTVDGREYTRVPVGAKQEITVDQGDGKVNVILVDEDGAVMHASTCDNQLCVNMGEVTVDNWEVRPNQQFIVCLPNRVSVELAVAE